MKSKAKPTPSAKKAKAAPAKKATAHSKPVKAPPLKLKAGPAPKATPSGVTPTVMMVTVDSIMPSPFQHRSGKMCDDTELLGLADSIKTNGILQPLTVRQARTDAPSGIRHELIFGHRRLAAAKLAGLKQVPCILNAMDDPHAQFANIIENLQRKDLSPIDEADGVNALTKIEELTAPQIAKMLGVSERWVFRRRKLAAIIPEWRKIIRDEKAGQLFCERLAACPAPLQKVLLKSALTKDPDAEKIGGTLYEAGARDIKEMPWSKVHKDWCFACPSVVDTVKDADADLGDCFRLNGCQFCGDPTCRATKEKAWIKERLEAFSKDPHVGSNKAELIKREHDAYNSWNKSPVHTTKFCVPYMITEGQEAGNVFWGQKRPSPSDPSRSSGSVAKEAAKPKPEIPGKKAELERINAIHALVEEGAQDTTSMRRALELVLLYGADFISDGKITSSRHSQFLKALNMPDDELAKAVSKHVREDHFNVWELDEQTYITTEKDIYDFKGESEQLALTFGIADNDIAKKMQEMLDGND
jgi:ParB/RepB/Spo0J family partition protein